MSFSKVSAAVCGLLICSATVVAGCSDDDPVTVPTGTDGLPTSGAVLDLENLASNTFVDGQDNWVDYPGQGQGTVAPDDTAVNGSLVIEPLVTTALNAPVYLSRTNDIAYSFDAYTGQESDHFMQFDLTADHIALLALGRDVDGNNLLSSAAGELGPRFGISDGNFYLEQAGDAQSFSAPMNMGDATGDWYRLRLTVNFQANAGQGSGSLQYMNLTNGDQAFRPVAGLQNIDLNMLNTDPAARPAQWNTVWLYLLTGGSRAPRVDNLVAHGRESN